MMQPKRRKYRKQHIPVLKGVAKRGYEVAFGTYGLKAMENGYLSSRQLESVRKVVVRRTRKVGKIWMRVFPDVPFTKKGLEMPMGKGKGDVDQYKAPVKKGKIILEVTGISEAEAKDVFRQAARKLPIKAKMVEKGEIH
ncbi:MAG: 50S ribosomal protein L16 [Candidatus Peribacteria bacterium]|nr:MAG: 50S ribosomal protein L16 [Candidatus Peribacteria bacterium]